MPRPKAPATVREWDRQPGESVQAHEAFRAYLELGDGRTLEAAAAKVGKTKRLLVTWSGPKGWGWQARLAAHDNWVQQARDEGRRRELAKESALWERRKKEGREKGYSLSQQLLDRVNVMLSLPITRKVSKKDGKVTIIKPANWTMATMASMAKLAIEMQMAMTEDALLDEVDGFDPTTATPEECRELLEKYKAKRKAVREASGE